MNYKIIAAKLRGEADQLAMAWRASETGLAEANVEIGRLNASLNGASTQIRELAERLAQSEWREKQSAAQVEQLIRAVTAVVTR